MLTLPPTVKVFIAKTPINMAKSFDALESLVRYELKEDPMSGHLFVFTNRRRDKLKILMWDRHGWSILYKRLESGTFKLPSADALVTSARLQIEAADLALILEGIELAGARRRKRWQPADLPVSRRPIPELDSRLLS
jgi:transposase